MKKTLTLILLFVTFLFTGKTLAQDSDTEKAQIHFSGFVDVYYAYDFNKPADGQRQDFFFNHNRHNEFTVNLGLLKIGVEHEKYRANLALQAGTFVNDNFAAEPGSLKNIFEANVGLSLNKQNNLWLDAGIFPSHLGFESAISTDNLTLTRSLVAESSPYYLAGAKMTYNPTEQWELLLVLCNGWQRMQRVPGNSMMSYGTQVSYKPSENTTLNWSTFYGTEDPDSLRRNRFFNNVYGIFQLTDNVELIAGVDFGFQQKAKGSSENDTWVAPVLIAQYRFDEKWAAAFRAEYFKDESQVIIAPETENGFNTMGYSLNLDYRPLPKVACRIESRWLNSKDAIFTEGSNQVDSNLFVVASIAVKIE
ncbi:porin [Flammeovirgaceae bacterium SG7u.111]|nr:porin [Flammeovirgaceae bacterium SG7u.132]WPO33437.1 porin [Flammeovirgaceae bacterium SG7u.111]